MKAAILQLLRASNGVVSGSVVSARLGISRVAVWKQIRSLQALGYDIRAGARGYRLAASPDVLHSWEFPGRAERVVHLPQTGSTMDVARELARKGCPDFTVVTAERQSAGRGRLRRVWYSTAGGLYFTLVARPEIPVALSPRVSFLASATLARLLRTGYGIAAGLKWPNDILVGGCKLCGLLSEMEAESERVAFITIGIGVNVNNRLPAVDPPATSMKTLLGRKVNRRELLSRFLDEFEEGLSAGDWDGVIPAWRRYQVTLGRPVRIAAGREELRGVALDVDADGALILQAADGSKRRIIYGDCFLAG